MEQENTLPEKLYFRKNGFYIEFIKNEWASISYLLRRCLSFLFDIGVYIAVLLILWQVFGFNMINSSLLTIAFYWLLIGFQFFLGKNKTLGMYIAGLELALYNGEEINKIGIIKRVGISTIYLLPIVGQIVCILSAITALFTHGLTPLDLMSKTQIITKGRSRALKNIYKEIREEN